MADIKNKAGIQPAVRKEFDVRDSAMAGDMVLAISPSTLDSAATTEDWSRTVKITLKNAAGQLHDWYNDATLGATIADTSTAGTAAITAATNKMVGGVANVVVTGTGDWVATDTDTLTLANQTILGYTVTGGTSVETFA